MLIEMTDEMINETNRLQDKYIAEFNQLAEKHHLKTRLKRDGYYVVCGSQDQFDNHTYQMCLPMFSAVNGSDLKALTEMLKFELE